MSWHEILGNDIPVFSRHESGFHALPIRPIRLIRHIVRGSLQPGVGCRIFRELYKNYRNGMGTEDMAREHPFVESP